MRKHHFTALASAGALSFTAAAPATAAPGSGITGPSTTTRPYILPVAEGVQTTSLLTVGDAAGPGDFRMVGIPDGLGARRTAAGAVELLMAHELRESQGKVRRHGQRGAFVSQFRIDPATLAVGDGRDLIGPGQTSFYDYPTGTTGTSGSTGSANAGPMFLPQSSVFNRFCSATLTALGGLLNPATGNGYDGQIFFGNEENGNNSRTFGILEDGTTEQLPRLGLHSWENTIPAANRSDKTLVMGQEDANPGQIWAYVGDKTRTGDAFDRAGLQNGKNHVADVVDQTVRNDAGFRDTVGKGVPAPVVFNEVDWNQGADRQNAEAEADGLSLSRVEDGAWDPDNPRDFYFVTTEGGDRSPAPGTTSARDGGGLWRLRYKDIEDPLRGAWLTLLLDGSEAPFLNKPDNMVIDTHGNLLIQEDPGNNPAVARVVAYDIPTGRRGVVAEFDRALFAPATPGMLDAPITADEESSGIIDGRGTIGDGRFILDAQAHKGVPPPDPDGLVEMGQLLTLDVRDFEAVYTGRAASSGATGATGPGGAAGAEGADGAEGPNGATGAQGASGDTGAPGASGDTGATGAQGTSGDTGATGAQGPSTTGSGGATGAQGQDGDAGALGQSGPKGDPGAPGTGGGTGAQGQPGAGATGANGGAGIPGALGPRGLQGVAGPPGRAGKSGEGVRSSGATCRLSRSRRGRQVTCRLVARSRSRATARLVKAGRLVATGRVVGNVATFAGRKLAKGTYSLVIGGRTTRVVIR